ncbi:unnamed protein product [Nesidiocoris tenuis]|uniref:Angiomotin C-terminal domain-containing protein n=1 Tax=Nesidiocoris tenuis TaxID=355587 RepID=A0A6H5HIC8_9HEMI|nr:unnamed protein product [Nesidiocoris tenuis]
MNTSKKQGRYMYTPATAHLSGRQRKRESVSGSETDVSTSNENLSNEERYVIRHTARQEPQGQENHAYNTLIIKDDSWRHVDNPPPYKGSHNTAKQVIYDTGVREITEIPDDYLKQSQVLKHLAKEVKVCSSAESSGESEHHRPMSSGKHQSSRSARIRNKLSKSQPDLTALSVDQENKILVHSLGNTRKDQQRCAQMVDHLMQENTSLKNELEQCYQRVAKAQKLEDEVGKVTRAHEELVATCDRRERLESARIMRLQQEVRRLQETNQRLVAQHIMSGGLDKRGEAWVAQLVTQNKELLATKERQEIELAAQRATLQEQRTHIDILDTALINAQANVVRLEEEGCENRCSRTNEPRNRKADRRSSVRPNQTDGRGPRCPEKGHRPRGQGLVGSSSGAGGGGGGSSGRPTEDIALLEKQGLCSQQNRNSSDSRCASLPPSSLPRPKSRKARVSGGSGGSEKEKKCGEYGRLSDSEVPPRRGSESPARVVKLGDYGRLSSDRSSSSTTSTTAKAGAYSRLSGDSTEQPTNKTTEVRLSPLPRHKPMSSSSSQTPPQMLQKADMGQYSQSSNDHSSYSHKQEMPPYVQKQELPPYMQKQEIPQYNKIPVSRSFLPPPRKLSDYGQSVFTPKPPSTNTNLPHLVRRGSLNREHPSQLPGPPTKSAIPGPNKYRIQF